MSPRAACRLEALGFTNVYDYAPGKTDWTGSGLPTQGAHADMPRPGKLARRVPTCHPGETVGTARERAGESGVCIVTTESDIVLGRLRGKALEGSDEASVEDVMEIGPTTVRYDEFLPDLFDRMQKSSVATILVTAPSGRLFGEMHRSDAEEVLKQLQKTHRHDG